MSVFQFIRRAIVAACGAAALGLASAPAWALDHVSFGTNWLAQAEHGGFYQAVADGTYAKYGLDVKIIPGGPQSANRSLLIAGKVDFYMGASQLEALDAIKAGIPLVDVAAIFQKDPQILMAHPDQGFDSFKDLAKADKLYLSKDAYVSFFEWMKKNFEGFRDEQYRPYTFNSAPFIADPKSVQQGYVSSEPFEVKKQTGWDPKVFLLADNGYGGYSTLISTTQALVKENPDLVQRFVDASIVGWYHYLYGDNTAANTLIKKDNPDITDDQIAYSIQKMKEYGIVDSGATETKGIGCITDDRYKAFVDELVAIKLIPADLDYKQAYRTDFVCKGVGLDLKK